MRGPSAVGDGGRRQRRQREYGDRRAARTRGENAIARVGGVQVAETKDTVTRHRPTQTAAVCGVVDEMDDTRKAKCVIPAADGSARIHPLARRDGADDTTPAVPADAGS